jgi:hypothetical protein
MLDRITPRALEGLTAAAWLDRVAPGPRARRFLETMVRVSTYSNMADVLPAPVALRQLQIAIGLRAKGVAYVDGGWQTLVAGLERAAAAQGVTIAHDATAARVTEDARVVLASGAEIAARHVVIALPRTPALHLVGMSSNPSPVRAACVDMILDQAPSRRLVLALEAPHYFSVHSPKDAAPPLRAHALRYLAPGEKGAEYKDVLAEWLEKAVPGLSVIGKRVLPEMEVASALPGCEVPLLPRVSFVGEWTSATHVLFDAVAESAGAAATRAIEDRVSKAA